MNILTTPGYDNFVKWMTNGQPRNMEGKPISDPAMMGKIAPPRPTMATASRLRPQVVTERVTQTRQSRQENIKLAARARSFAAEQRLKKLWAYLDTIAERPNETELAKRFGIAQKRVHKAVVSKFGEYRNAKAARAWLATQTKRPSAKEVAEKFGVSKTHVGIIIQEVFGKMDRNVDRNAGVAWMIEHPNASYAELLQRFGKKSNQWATIVRRMAREAVAK